MKYNGYLKLNIDNLSKRVEEGYIRRQQHPTLPISLYNYAEKAQYSDTWDNEILNSRGLVLRDADFTPVNGVFPKFFNASPDNIPQLPIRSITEKMDGSFVSLFNYPLGDGNGIWITSTRGSFGSEQAQWAMAFLNKNYNFFHLNRQLAYIFEAIYPENRIVVNYGDRKDLVLLGARHVANGTFNDRVSLNIIAAQMGFSQPKMFTFSSVDKIFDAAKTIAANEEGWVVEYSDNSRLKFKGDAYVLAHRVMTNVSFKRVLEAMQLGKLDAMIEGVPDEFLDEVKAYRKEIEDKLDSIKVKVIETMKNAPQQGFTEPEKDYRKRFAQWAFQQKDIINPHYLLNHNRDGYIEEAVYKNEFNDRIAKELEPSL